MAATYRERRKIVAEMLDNSGGDVWCEVVLLIHRVDPSHRCGLRCVDVHEIKTRGRGGSIVNRPNLLPTCRPCHNWIGDHPKEAQELGLTVWSWQDEPNEETGGEAT